MDVGAVVLQCKKPMLSEFALKWFMPADLHRNCKRSKPTEAQQRKVKRLLERYLSDMNIYVLSESGTVCSR